MRKEIKIVGSDLGKLEVLNETIRDSFRIYIYGWLRKNKERVVKVENTLKTKYNIESPLRVVLDYIIDNLEFTLGDKKYIVAISNTKKFKGIRLSTLAKDIDKGDLVYKGEQILTNAFKFTQDNVNIIFLGEVISLCQ